MSSTNDLQKCFLSTNTNIKPWQVKSKTKPARSKLQSLGGITGWNVCDTCLMRFSRHFRCRRTNATCFSFFFLNPSPHEDKKVVEKKASSKGALRYQLLILSSIKADFIFVDLGIFRCFVSNAKYWFSGIFFFYKLLFCIKTKSKNVLLKRSRKYIFLIKFRKDYDLLLGSLDRWSQS